MHESNQYVSSIVSDEEVFRLKAKRDWDNSINTAYEIGYELGIAKSVIERLTIHKVELNPKLLIIVLDRLFSLNVTTEKIAKHTGIPADLVDDLREMRYNEIYVPLRNTYGDTNKIEENKLREYEDSLKAYRDIKNSLDTAKREGVAEGIEIGREEGRAEGRAEGEQSKAIDIAKNLKSMGLSIADIIKATGLSENDIIKL